MGDPEEAAAAEGSAAVNVEAADGWRARYYVGGDFYSFVFDPQGNVVQKQYASNHGNAPYSTASFEAYGKRDGEYDNFGTTPASHQDPAQFGGQSGYYTDVETGLLCLRHRYYDVDIMIRARASLSTATPLTIKAGPTCTPSATAIPLMRGIRTGGNIF